jgi:hypothetical protein
LSILGRIYGISSRQIKLFRFAAFRLMKMALILQKLT